MEFRHLRYIIAVAEEGHITRAAERLGIAQPPLSRLIKAIEQEINVQLFRRVPRGVELTDAGRTFLAGARATFANLDRTLESARRTARGEEGQISVAFTSSIAFHPLVPRVIREFRETFPLVAVTLAESNGAELMVSIESDRLDAAFIRSHVVKLEGLVFHPLLEEPLVVALPKGHALARGQARAVLPLKRLSNETFVFSRRYGGQGSGARYCLRRVSGSRLQPPRRTGSALRDVDASFGRRRDRYFHRSGLPAAHKYSRRGLSSPYG